MRPSLSDALPFALVVVLFSVPCASKAGSPVIFEDANSGEYSWEQAQAKGNPPPRYPGAALGAEGTVLIAVRVASDGFPEGIRVQESSGNRNLDQAALEAVSKWRFQAGDGVSAERIVPFTFSMN